MAGNGHMRAEILKLRGELAGAAAGASASAIDWRNLTDSQWCDLFASMLEAPDNCCCRDPALAEAIQTYRAAIAAGLPEPEQTDHPVNAAFFGCCAASQACALRERDRLAEADPVRLAGLLVAAAGSWPAVLADMVPSAAAFYDFRRQLTAGRVDEAAARRFVETCREGIESRCGQFIGS